MVTTNLAKAIWGDEKRNLLSGFSSNIATITKSSSINNGHYYY